ncbi:hypothetical protein D3C86_1289360 [compost metagenome]
MTIHLVRTFKEVVDAGYRVIAVDIPVGMPDKGVRDCDPQARKLLGPRRSSVFPAPIRPVLKAQDYSQACDIGRQADGRSLSQQAWAITKKIAEVDRMVTPDLQGSIIEIHPELCFWALNGGRPLEYPKKDFQGMEARRMLLKEHLLDPVVFYDLRLAGAGRDDIHDALAALWTARRYAQGDSVRIPEHEQRDAKGLRMEMWY